MAATNPCSKTVTPETAYEVWQSYDGSWTYFVLKKYQSPEKEAQNPYARWYCLVKSPITPNAEFGDVYVSTAKRGTQPIDNPLHRFFCVKGTSIQVLDAIGLSKYPVTDLALRDERLWQYLKLSIPPKAFAKVKRLLEEAEVPPGTLYSLWYFPGKRDTKWTVKGENSALTIGKSKHGSVRKRLDGDVCFAVSSSMHCAFQNA